MSDKDLSRLSDEDPHVFYASLAAFYGEAVETSLALLKKHIRNSLYRLSSKRQDAVVEEFVRREETVNDVFDRLMWIESVKRRRGERINDFKGMAYTAAQRIIQEYTRTAEYWELTNALPSPPVDEPNAPEDTHLSMLVSPIDAEIRRRRLEIVEECHIDCFRKLPAEIQELLNRYDDLDDLPLEERKASRRRIAEEEAARLESLRRKKHQTPDETLDDSQESPPPNENRNLENLEAKVCKLRNKLEQCAYECASKKAPDDPHLQSLMEQQSRVGALRNH